MVINTNIAAQTGARLLSQSSDLLSKSLARLSSGSKIISPEDDVAGAAVSLRFDAQINRISAASANVGNAVSFNQTQDGFLQKVGTALDRMSELAVLSQDVTKTDGDRTLYNQEFTTLGTYINDLATKDFNGVSLFNGAPLQVTTDSDAKKFTMASVNLSDPLYTAVTNSSNISSLGSANTALTNVKNAINKLTSDRSSVGSNISVLDSYTDQLGVLTDNLSAANSRIKDVDVAQESTEYARANVLVQSGTAMLAQANSMPSSVLKLLQ